MVCRDIQAETATDRNVQFYVRQNSKICHVTQA